MLKKFPVILFFIATAVPTEEEQAEAMQFGPNVRFRNAEFGDHAGALEECDGVAGVVPARYAEAYPEASKAIEAYMDANSERLSKARQNAQAAAQARETVVDAPAAQPTGKAKSAPAPQPAAAGWTANT
jgi:hypothetical protein